MNQILLLPCEKCKVNSLIEITPQTSDEEICEAVFDNGAVGNCCNRCFDKMVQQVNQRIIADKKRRK